ERIQRHKNYRSLCRPIGTSYSRTDAHQDARPRRNAARSTSTSSSHQRSSQGCGTRPMRKLLGITLGIMTALGGFVDLGQIVFTTQAGALFGYKLLWAIVLGSIAIIVYMEMCGRVAVVAQVPVFAVVRTRLGHKLGLATLIASNLLNLIT